MLRTITSVIFGTILGMIIMMMFHYLSMLIYPLPEGIIFPAKTDEEIKSFNIYLETAPSGSFVLAMISHLLGVLFASIIGCKIFKSKAWSKRTKSTLTIIIIGIIFTITGFMNLQNIPHPYWFKIELLLYIPFAFLGYKLIAKKN